MRIQVDGLKEFNRQLRRVDAALPRVVQRVNKAAAQTVASDAKTLALGKKGRRRFAALIGSSAGANYAAVRYRGRAHPASGGWIFGSLRFGQFERWVGNQYSGNPYEPGYGDFGKRAVAVGPAITHNLPKIRRDYDESLRKAFRQAYPKG